MAPTRTPRTQTPTARTPRRAGTARPRPTAAPTGRRTPAFPGRKKPAPQSNAKKVFGAVAGAVPGLLQKAGTPAKKAKPGSKKGGAGLAILGAGAAAAALKNRDKLPGKLGGHQAHPATTTTTSDVSPAQPVTPVPVTPVSTNDDTPGITPIA